MYRKTLELKSKNLLPEGSYQLVIFTCGVTFTGSGDDRGL